MIKRKVLVIRLVGGFFGRRTRLIMVVEGGVSRRASKYSYCAIVIESDISSPMSPQFQEKSIY